MFLNAAGNDCRQEYVLCFCAKIKINSISGWNCMSVYSFHGFQLTALTNIITCFYSPQLPGTPSSQPRQSVRQEVETQASNQRGIGDWPQLGVAGIGPPHQGC